MSQHTCVPAGNEFDGGSGGGLEAAGGTESRPNLHGCSGEQQVSLSTCGVLRVAPLGCSTEAACSGFTINCISCSRMANARTLEPAPGCTCGTASCEGSTADARVNSVPDGLLVLHFDTDKSCAPMSSCGPRLATLVTVEAANSFLLLPELQRG